VTDNFGLEGGPNESRLAPIVLQFTKPVRSLGIDFPGILRVELFSGDTSLGSSDHFGSSGPGHFGGVVSDLSFDRAVISRDWLDEAVYIDNLYVAPVPEPSTWALLALSSGLVWFLRRNLKIGMRHT
jgi:PEP-CTERM motif